MLRPSVTIDSSSIDAFVEAQTIAAGKRAKRLMEQMGQEMVDEAIRIVRAELPTTKHKLNTTHLAESFTYRVESGPNRGGFPYTVHLTIKPGVSKGKIGALNYGVEPKPTNYVILPRNVPRAMKFSGGVDPAFLNKRGVAMRPYAVRTMTSGPREGVFFLERARDTVMTRHGFTAE